MINTEQSTQNQFREEAPFRTSTTPLDGEIFVSQGFQTNGDPDYIEVPERDPNIYIPVDSESSISNELIKVDEWLKLRIRSELVAQIYSGNDMSVNLTEIRDTIVIPEYVKVAQGYNNEDLVDYVSAGVSRHIHGLLTSPSPEGIDVKVSEYTQGAKRAALVEVIEHIEGQLASFDPSSEGYEQVVESYLNKLDALEAELAALIEVDSFNKEEREVDAVLNLVSEEFDHDKQSTESGTRAWYQRGGAAATAIKAVFTTK